MNEPLNDVIQCSSCKKFFRSDHFTLAQLHTRGRKICAACRKAKYQSKVTKQMVRSRLDKLKVEENKRNLCNWNNDAIYC